jgi:predicted metal-dependent hydrolase
MPLLPKFRSAKPPALEEREHTIAGRVLPLKLVRHARATRLTLRIERGGAGLRVTVPPKTPAHEVDRFLHRQREWLEARVEKLPENPVVRPGAKLPIRGVPHLIVHEGGRGTVSLRQGTSGPEIVVHGDIRFLPRRLADFLKAEAKKELSALVARHAAAVGRKPQAIRFRDTVSRWGSCTAQGALSFSWRIMMAPPTVIDYLAAHEAAHLREMNHGEKFWALCRDLCPRTDEAKAWLKRNGAALQAIGFG